MAVIYSSLFRSGMLATESTFFPLMVQAATSGVGKEYGDWMLRKCAADYGVLQLLNLSTGEGMDAVITTQISTEAGGAALDQAINAAVIRYDPPVTKPDPDPAR